MKFPFNMTNNKTIKILFQPSFHNEVEVVIKSETISVEVFPRLISTEELENKRTRSVQDYLKLKEYKKLNKEAEKKRGQAVCKIETKDFKELWDAFYDLAYNKEKPEYFVLDGVIGKGEVIMDADVKPFEFHSPNPQMRSYQAIYHLMILCFKCFKDSEVMEALELVETYFGFFPNWKIVEENPLTCRIYGSLSSDVSEELNQFLNGLPRVDYMVFNLTNFDGMGTFLYDTFKGFISRQNKVEWKVNTNNKRVLNHLKEMGVLEENMLRIEE